MHRRNAFLALAFVLSARTSAAQTKGYAAGWHDPSEPGGDWYLTESLDLRGALRPEVGVLMDWTYPPLTLRGTQLVRDRVSIYARGALVLRDRFRVGFALPAVIFQHGDALVADGALVARGARHDAVGDLRLTADARLFGTYASAVRGAVGLAAYLPTGSRDLYTSDGVVKLAPRVLLAAHFKDIVGAVKLGMAFRTARPSFAGRELGDELFFGASVGIKVNDRFVLGPELAGTATVTGANALSKRSFPLEALLGGRARIAEDFQVGSSIGGGLSSADGSPSLRVLAIAEWTPDPCVDKDGDGICAAEDACPDVDGVRTRDRRTNGCPVDRDGDRVPDAIDACPDQPGAPNGDAAMRGCPTPAAEDPEAPPER